MRSSSTSGFSGRIWLLASTFVVAALAALLLAGPVLAADPEEEADDFNVPELMCADFSSQAEAQEALDATDDQATIDELDPDGTGVACADEEYEPEEEESDEAPVQPKALTKAAAVSATGAALKRKLGGRFVSRSRYVVRCARLDGNRFRCRASWNHAGRWRATVTVRQRVSKGKPRISSTVSSVVKPKAKAK